MKLSMTFKEYISLVMSYSNVPLTLNRLTLPFGIISDSEESSSLLVGHILDDLASRLGKSDMVDCIDVITTAFDLGHEQAGSFLEEAPYIISKMARDLGLTNLN